MSLLIPSGAPTLFIIRSAYERSGFSRRDVDGRLGLTPDEFRVEGRLVVVGPLPDAEGVRAVADELETIGLEYFDDFFELSGNWPEWLKLYATAASDRTG